MTVPRSAERQHRIEIGERSPTNPPWRRGAGGSGSSRLESPASPLTGRELDVLTLAALGFKNSRIGRALHITESTVKSTLSSAYRKLGASNKAQAVLVAHVRGYLEAL